MKNILKYTALAAAIILSSAACEKNPDYQTTIDAAPALTYANPRSGNTFETLVKHSPIGSTGEYTTEFQVSANTSNHPDVGVNIVIAPELVAEYNEKHETSYEALPEEYVEIENASVVIPENATISTDTVRVHLSQTADLSKLTGRAYLAPLKVVSDGLSVSEEMGTLWFIVNTEINLIRPISSADDMVGFLAGGSSLWTADCGDYANLFDGSNNTGVGFSTSKTNVLTFDMKKSMMVTGLKINTNSLGRLFIEYSEDGTEWNQAGTPVSGEYIYNGSSESAGDFYTAVYDYFTARYIRLSFELSSVLSNINEISVYVIESTEPTVYTMTGADNVVTGKVVHKKGVGSISDFSASFKPYVTVSSQNGYNVTAAVDNSLISAYNSAHGTSYKAMPDGNVNIQNASQAIAAGDNVASGNVVVSLTGDLTGLNDENGYLIPVKLSASGAVVSESRGVVYAVITSENNLIRAISSADEIVGFPAGGKSSWSSSTEGASALFDDNNSTSVNFNFSGNELTVNMAAIHLVTGLHFYTYNLDNLNIQYSVDGSTWISAGTVASNEVVWTGGPSNPGNYYVAFSDHIEARYLKLTFDCSVYYYRRMYELSVYEIESTDPTIYTVCGTDNTFTGKITHHTIAGSSASLSASFKAMTTVSSPDGYAVGAEVNSSLVSEYNRQHGTKYAALDPSYVEISGAPCQIAANANSSAGTISISLKGDLSQLKNKNGYLIPVQLTAPAGAVASSGRGVVYAVLEVEESDAVMQKNFDINAIAGAVVADRSGWKITECDSEGVHSGAYDNLLDGNTTTYIRTWGGPVTFTVDLGKEYEMTGLVITARTDNNTYAGYQPKSIQIRGSVDGSDYTDYGTASTSEGTIVASKPSSYVSFYGSKTVRYLKIEAGYGSNMGTSEFNIYVK